MQYRTFKWAGNRAHHRHLFITVLAPKLHITTLNGWYTVTTDDVEQAGGGTILKKYNYSLSRALRVLFPTHNWQEWRFKNVPANHWDALGNQIDKFNAIGRNLRLKSLEDWYSVSPSDILAEKGAAIFSTKYDSSMYKALSSIYPKYNWRPEQFTSNLQRFWANDQRNTLSNIAKALDVKTLSDWHTVRTTQVIKRGGGTVLHSYRGSLPRMLQSLYTEFPWNFKVNREKPIGYWEEPVNQMAFLKTTANALRIRSPQDWYRVSIDQIAALGGGGFCRYFPYALSGLNNDFTWQWHLFSKVSRKSKQWQLINSVQTLL